MSRLGVAVSLALVCIAMSTLPAARADDSPLVKLLKSGRVPEERQGTILDMIAQRGTAADLSYLFDRALGPQGFSPAVRLKAISTLAQAYQTRKLRPQGDLNRLGALLKQGVDPAVRVAAVRLAGLWRVEGLSDSLQSLARANDSSAALRSAALEALASIGGQAGRTSIEAMTAPSQPWSARAQALAALVRLDLDAAADKAIAVLRDASSGEDLTPLLAAFLNRQGGADKLAAAMAKNPLPADPAKLALRALYGLGRSDSALVAELSKTAGISADVQPLDKPQMDKLVGEVTGRGNPERGEAIFRRADLNCTRCHAVAGAGGGVGPDLSPLGSSSPIDYIVNSIMVPDQAIKEEFHTLLVLTTDGQVSHGIVVDKDDQRLVIKEATGEQRTIPMREVEDSKEGGSLMPKGLVNLMTHDEFVDLVRFLSELGKPGPYAIHTVPTIQRWRVLKPVPDELAKTAPHADAFRTQVLEADASQWLPAYALVAGTLPLTELVQTAGSPVLYIQGELNASAAGPVEIRLNSAEGLDAWLDDEPLKTAETMPIELKSGRHSLTLRVDTTKRKANAVKVEVVKPSGSSAEFVVVGGR